MNSLATRPAALLQEEYPLHELSASADPVPSDVAVQLCPALAAWWHLASAYNAMASRCSRFLEERGLTGAQYGVLRSVGDAGPEGLMLSALSERLMVTCGNITGVVDRLETRGLLRRERSREDRRVVMARLTPEGRALYRRVVPEMRRYLAELLAGMAEADQLRLAALCAEMKGIVSGEHR